MWIQSTVPINKLASPCTAKRSTYGQGNLEKARLGTLTGGSGASSSSQVPQSSLLTDNAETLTPAEANAIGNVEDQVSQLQSNLALQVVVPSDSELSSCPPSSDSEQAPVASSEGGATESGSE